MKTTTDVLLVPPQPRARRSRPASFGPLEERREPEESVSFSGTRQEPALMKTAVRSLLRPAAAVAVAVLGYGLSRLLHPED